MCLARYQALDRVRHAADLADRTFGVPDDQRCRRTGDLDPATESTALETFLRSSRCRYRHYGARITIDDRRHNERHHGTAESDHRDS